MSSEAARKAWVTRRANAAARNGKGNPAAVVRPVALAGSFCAYCAVHNHGYCTGDGCACGARGHNPDVETAAAMRRYDNPCDARLPVEVRATAWRRKDEAR